MNHSVGDPVVRRLASLRGNKSIFGSVDAPGNGPVHRFLLSARPGLWPAILLATAAFAYITQYPFAQAGIIAVNLCASASLGFLFNDALDREIDKVNNVSRWSMASSLDACLFLCVVALQLGLLAGAYLFVSTNLFVALVSVLFLAVAYSILFKRIILLGNLVAAGLSMTPGLLILLDAASFQKHMNMPSVIFPAVAFLIVGFLLLISREVRFDEFDRKGDRKGMRLTLPMIFGKRVLDVVHIVLIAVALSLLCAALVYYGRHSTPINLLGAASTLAIAVWLMLPAYLSTSKEAFYKRTRVAMLLIPASMMIYF